jgi:hypothetical protein
MYCRTVAGHVWSVPIVKLLFVRRAGRPFATTLKKEIISRGSTTFTPWRWRNIQKSTALSCSSLIYWFCSSNNASYVLIGASWDESHCQQRGRWYERACSWQDCYLDGHNGKKWNKALLFAIHALFCLIQRVWYTEKGEKGCQTGCCGTIRNGRPNTRNSQTYFSRGWTISVQPFTTWRPPIHSDTL